MAMNEWGARIERGEVRRLEAAKLCFVPVRQLAALPFTEADRPFVRRLAGQDATRA